MTEAPVDIPSDVLEAARLAAIPAHEPPAAGENPAPPAEKVGCFLSFFSPVFCSLCTLHVLCRIKAGQGFFFCKRKSPLL